MGVNPIVSAFDKIKELLAVPNLSPSSMRDRIRFFCGNFSAQDIHHLITMTEQWKLREIRDRERQANEEHEKACLSARLRAGTGYGYDGFSDFMSEQWDNIFRGEAETQYEFKRKSSAAIEELKRLKDEATAKQKAV